MTTRSCSRSRRAGLHHSLRPLPIRAFRSRRSGLFPRAARACVLSTTMANPASSSRLHSATSEVDDLELSFRLEGNRHQHQGVCLMFKPIAAIIGSLCVLSCAAEIASAAEIKVLAAGALRGAVVQLVPEF